MARRCCGYLALLALLLQISVSFGHVHARDFVDTGSGTAVGWRKTTIAKAAVSAPGALADDEDQCPICFSAFLLATSSVLHAVQPAAFFNLGAVAYTDVRSAFVLPDSGRAPFQSRGPPLA